jgi:hypothetical protein
MWWCGGPWIIQQSHQVIADASAQWDSTALPSFSNILASDELEFLDGLQGLDWDPKIPVPLNVGALVFQVDDT